MFMPRKPSVLDDSEERSTSESRCSREMFVGTAATTPMSDASTRRIVAVVFGVTDPEGRMARTWTVFIPARR